MNPGALRPHLPRSLWGQLLAWLIGGLLVTHAVGLLVLSRNHGDVHPLARTKDVEMYARIFRGAATLDPAAAAAALAAASDGTASFRLVEAPGIADDGEADAEFGQQLRRRLGLPADALRICAEADCAAHDTAGHGERQRVALVLEARRPDGRWLQGTLWSQVRQRWWWPVSFWLQVSLVPVFLAAALAARGLLTPGRALVAAAGRVSRGERVEALPERGPKEIREIVRAFNLMQERLGRYVEDRTRMLAAISHDFRTPITSLRLRAELVEDRDVRASMVRTLDRMRQMMDETLVFARDEAQAETSQDVPLAALIEEVLAERREGGGDVAWAEPPPPGAPPYRCRPMALGRAVANLVDNAIQHGRRARVRLHAGDGWWLVDIDDEGPGLPPEQREAAFAPFARWPSAGVQPGDSVGLGLAIARSCARAHGGDVELLTAPNGRSLRARLKLPA